MLGIKEVKDVLKPFGKKIDVLLYYSGVAGKLKKFLKGKEIATKIWIGNPRMPYFLRRGSKEQPLFIEQMAAINQKFLETRNTIESLKDAKPKISKVQANIWNYFVPRHLVEFFYATNCEGAGKPIDRIFFDIDRTDKAPEEAQQVAKKFVETIKSDKEFNKLVKYNFFTMWTGSSFHVYLMLKKKMPNAFYDRHIHYSKNEPLASFTGRWVEAINKELKIAVKGGHEKAPGFIVIDPSQTPSGKLARSPFSLHVTNNKVDGIALPVKLEALSDKSLVKKLKQYTPEKVLKELDRLGKLL